MIANTKKKYRKPKRYFALLPLVSLLLLSACIGELPAQESEMPQEDSFADASNETSSEISADESTDDIERIIEYQYLPEGNADSYDYSYKITASPSVLMREYEQLLLRVDAHNESNTPYAVCLVRIDDLPKETVSVGTKLFLSPLTVEIWHVIMASNAFDFAAPDKVVAFDRVNWRVTDESTEVEYWAAHLPITDESSYYIVELSYAPENSDILDGCEYGITALTIPINKQTVGDSEYQNQWAERMHLHSDVAGLSRHLINMYIEQDE